MRSMNPGGGGRFAALKSKIESQGKSPESAGAIAVAAGRAKYGNEKMNAFSHRAKMKASKHK